MVSGRPDLLFDSLRTGSSYELWDLAVDSGKVGQFGGITSTQPLNAVFSPDGHWVAYNASAVPGSVRSANRGVFVQPYPSTGARYQAPKQDLDFHAAWAPDGRSLFYVPYAVGRTVKVDVQTRPTLTFGNPVEVPGAPRPGAIATGLRAYDILPDGAFVSTSDSDTGAVNSTELRVILNWFEELKRLAPPTN